MINYKKNNSLIKNLKKKAFIAPSNNMYVIPFGSGEPNQKIRTEWFKFLLFKKPINLLFSIDQFLFEFTKKQPQKRKSSEFLQQLKQRKKLCFFYGDLSQKQIIYLLKKSQTFPGCFSKNFLFLLERRLDVVLYRSRLASSISSARQLITHKKILVNDNLVNIPSYSVKNGDIISFQIRDLKQQSLSFRPLSSQLVSRKKKYLGQNLFSKLSRFSSEKKTKMNIHNQRNVKKKNQSLIEFLLKKIETRAHLKKDQKNFALLKYKPLISQKARFLSFSLQPRLTNISASYLENRLKPKQKRFTRELMSVQKNKHFSRNLLLQILGEMSNKNIFRNLLLFKLKKQFLNKRNYNKNSIFVTKPTLRFGGLKPNHLEISYNLKSTVFLYSPQRLSFPFYIDVDLIVRSFQ